VDLADLEDLADSHGSVARLEVDESDVRFGLRDEDQNALIADGGVGAGATNWHCPWPRKRTLFWLRIV